MKSDRTDREKNWESLLQMSLLSEESIGVSQKEWEQILRLMSQMGAIQELPSGPRPMLALSDLREDTVAPSLPVEEALCNASRTVDGCFCVPKML